MKKQKDDSGLLDLMCLAYCEKKEKCKKQCDKCKNDIKECLND